MDTTGSRFNLEPYGLTQPFQVREILQASRDSGEVHFVIVRELKNGFPVPTVQLHQSGWALLAINAKIYLWRYIGKVLRIIL